MSGISVEGEVEVNRAIQALCGSRCMILDTCEKRIENGELPVCFIGLKRWGLGTYVLRKLMDAGDTEIADEFRIWFRK